MRKGTLWLGATIAAVACIGISACGSDSSEGEPGANAGAAGAAGEGGADAGPAGAAGSQAGAAGSEGGAAGSQDGGAGSSNLVMNCQPQVPDGWTPSAYVHAVGHQNKCSPKEMSDYYACYKWGDTSCIDDATHQECNACMEAPHGTKPPPALISHPGLVELNTAGCLELKGTDTKCPAKWDAMTQCMAVACDPVCPKTGDGGPVFTTDDHLKCRTASTASGGPCESYVKPAYDCANAQITNMELQKCFAGTFSDRIISHGREFCGSAAGGSCTPYLPPGYQDPPYVSPVGMHANVCTEAQITEFWDVCFGDKKGGQSCVNFQSAHPECFSCMISIRGSAKWGAIVSFFSLNQANTSGCLEAQGQADCAHKLQALQQCQHFACIAGCPWDGLDAISLLACKETAAEGVCAAQNAPAAACLASLPAAVKEACFPIAVDPDAGADAGSSGDSNFHTEAIGAATALCGP